jgi:hypothetical protein
MPKHYSMKTYGGTQIDVYTFLNSNLDGGEWPATRSGHFIPAEPPPPPVLFR